MKNLFKTYQKIDLMFETNLASNFVEKMLAILAQKSDEIRYSAQLVTNQW